MSADGIELVLRRCAGTHPKQHKKQEGFEDLIHYEITNLSDRVDFGMSLDADPLPDEVFPFSFP